MIESVLSVGVMWKRLACALAAGATIFSTATDSRAGDDDLSCRFFDGPASAVAPATCSSPVGLCTHGQLSGDFKAQYDFVAATLESANDPADPTKFVFTGHSVITTPDGTMNTDDNGVVHISGGAPAPFATTILIVSGTGRFAGATGTFVDRGTTDLATGANSGKYIAQICRVDH